MAEDNVNSETGPQEEFSRNVREFIVCAISAVAVSSSILLSDHYHQAEAERLRPEASAKLIKITNEFRGLGTVYEFSKTNGQHCFISRHPFISKSVDTCNPH